MSSQVPKLPPDSTEITMERLLQTIGQQVVLIQVLQERIRIMEAKAKEEIPYATPKIIPNKEETPYYNPEVNAALRGERM